MTVKELIDSRHPLQVPVEVSKYMAGCKRAVWHGGTLYVSPAMLELLKDPEGFERVAAAIQVIEAPAIDWFDLVPLTNRVGVRCRPE